jgi:hypothetical protein
VPAGAVPSEGRREVAALDPVASKETPFFARLASSVPDAVQNLLSKPFDALETQLERLGVSVDAIDYVAFDHMHTQDLRPLMGTTDGAHAPRFPNAKLLVPRAEWDDWDDLHPMQRAWFIADGKQRVRTEQIVLTDGDLVLGVGAMLVRTPGHTTGNQTLFMSTPDGVWGVSENGTCADNWSPHESRIAGLARVARHQDLDVILNANTPELGATQYTSMILERTIVDPVRRAPGFFQMFSSSEILPSALAPGLTPTLRHEKLEYGTVTRTRRAAAKPEPMRGVEGRP